MNALWLFIHAGLNHVSNGGGGGGIIVYVNCSLIVHKYV